MRKVELGRASFSGETCGTCGKPQPRNKGPRLSTWAWLCMGLSCRSVLLLLEPGSTKFLRGAAPTPLPQGARTGVEHPGCCCGRSPGHKPLKIRSKASCPCHEAAPEGATICPPFPQGEAEGGRARPRAGPAGGNVAAPTGTARPLSRPLPARINARSCWTLRSVIGCLCEQRLSLGP